MKVYIYYRAKLTTWQCLFRISLGFLLPARWHLNFLQVKWKAILVTGGRSFQKLMFGMPLLDRTCGNRDSCAIFKGDRYFLWDFWVKNANKWLIVFLHVFANWYSCIFIALFYINCLHLVDFFVMTLRWKGCKSHVLEQKIKHRLRRLRGSLSLIGYSLAVSLHKHGVLEGWLFSIPKATAKKKFTYACTELRMSSFVAPFFGCANRLLQIMYHIPGPIILLICS